MPETPTATDGVLAQSEHLSDSAQHMREAQKWADKVTGEAATPTPSEQMRVRESALQLAASRIPRNADDDTLFEKANNYLEWMTNV